MSASRRGGREGLKVSFCKKNPNRNCLHILLRLTHAVVSPVDLHVLGGAHTGVVALGVVAGTRAADPDAAPALVDVCEETWTRGGG